MICKVFHLKRILIGVAGCAVLAIGICLLGAGRAAVTTGAGCISWGLSFQKNGLPPTGSATPETLAAHHAYYIGDTAKKTIYLTFDAGYENGYTATILDTLKKRQVPAAFFVVGHYLDAAPDMVRRMVREGHIVGNHTLDHPDMSAITDRAAFARQLTEVADKYETLIGQPMPRYYRPPQGKFSDSNLEIADSMGYKTMLWSLAYVDWNTDNQPTAEAAFSKLLPRLHNGAVILLHVTSATNAAILDDLVTQCQNMGYSFGTLDQLTA